MARRPAREKTPLAVLRLEEEELYLRWIVRTRYGATPCRVTRLAAVQAALIAERSAQEAELQRAARPAKPATPAAAADPTWSRNEAFHRRDEPLEMEAAE